MKNYFLIMIALVVLFAGCDLFIKDNGKTDEKKTSLTINNMSSYNLLKVEYSSNDFGDIISLRDATINVKSGTRYVSFSLLINNVEIKCRTTNPLTCEEGKNNELTITNNALITTIVDDFSDTLKNIIDTMTIELNKPQIVIKQGNTIIEQHSDFSFGTALINADDERTFTIQNTGKTNLTFETVNSNRINMTDNTSGYFSVLLQPLSPTVTPGSSVTFNIRFNPKAKGNNFAASVEIKTNSRYNDEFIFRVVGNCSNEYQIGDTGPGGGMVFFAQGGQYKECSGELGSFNWATAMTTASAYKGGGFSYWYLPNSGELDLMYENLHKKGLGGFYYDYYWSSTTASSSSSYATSKYFFSGSTSTTSNRTNLCRVRAVRSFTLN